MCKRWAGYREFPRKMKVENAYCIWLPVAILKVRCLRGIPETLFIPNYYGFLERYKYLCSLSESVHLKPIIKNHRTNLYTTNGFMWKCSVSKNKSLRH